jgi:hypothetical protein
MTMKRLSKPLQALADAAQAAEHKKAKQRGSYGAASDCRRIDPVTGAVIEIIAKRGPQKAERLSLWRRKTAKR